jgi:uncharacterized protein YdhG (YjbR/CyaY superfamily)
MHEARIAMATFATVDEYIASFPPDRQTILEEVRRAMRRGATGTEETISYGIPTFKLEGRYVIYFAGWKDHISVYPVPEGDATLQKDIATYKAAKGTLRFPLDKPIPYDLIERLAAAAMQARVTAKG